MNARMPTVDGVDEPTIAVLRTLLLCDLVDSTGLVERLGDRAAAELIRKHDRLARTIADRHGGREIDKTDGFMMMFERPIQAVAFALDYQRGLKQLNAAEGTTLSARVGIHVGDVVVWDNSSADVAKGAKPTEVEGLVKPITSRLMNLALPNQILLSNIAYVLAHRAQGELGVVLEKVRWRTHGRYRFRGIPDPVPVFEVGEEGLAPLKAPPWSSKAHREVPFWRRPATMVIEALVVVALLTIPLVMFMRPEPAIAFASRDWVVVGSLNNLTGETVFDDALESALRIGLEQSRYVNVLPDLKVRDTVKRMQRDPDATKVDRAVGSEVAIRDGAKALILPTVAEVGGRVRITAEVIDPHTQTTVYSESADGTGAESVLGSLDTINGRLRERLGEALATVSSDSMPLEKVATKNLDALRAYSIGQNAYSKGELGEAASLQEQALTLDPGFALAEIALAKTRIVQGRRSEALALAESAVARSDRLSPRDALYSRAWLATTDGGSQREALGRWKLLTETYPDFLAGQSQYAYYLWEFGNQLEAAMKPAMLAASPNNPRPVYVHLLIGTLHMAGGRFDATRLHYGQAGIVDMPGLAWPMAHVHAVQGRFAEADEILLQGRPSAPMDVDLALAASTMQVDRGQWAMAKSTLAEAARWTPAPPAVRRVALANMGLRILDRSSAADGDDLVRSVDEQLDGYGTLEHADRGQWLLDILFATHLVVEAGRHEEAARVLTEVSGKVRIEDYPIPANLKAMIEAGLAIDGARPRDALGLLRPFLDGNEIYLTHVLAMKAQAAIGDLDAAQAEAEWLSTHRGRAYAEVNVSQALPVNIAHARLALIDAADLALQRNDKERARVLIAQAEAQWPALGTVPAFRARIRDLKSSL